MGTALENLHEKIKGEYNNKLKNEDILQDEKTLEYTEQYKLIVERLHSTEFETKLVEYFTPSENKTSDNLTTKTKKSQQPTTTPLDNFYTSLEQLAQNFSLLEKILDEDNFKPEYKFTHSEVQSTWLVKCKVNPKLYLDAPLIPFIEACTWKKEEEPNLNGKEENKGKSTESKSNDNRKIKKPIAFKNLNANAKLLIGSNVTDLMVNATFPRATEDPQLARLFYKFRHRFPQLTPEYFNQIIGLPVRTIDSKIPENNFTSGKYTFRKLKTADRAGYILGHLSYCCQSIGAEGDSCARYGMQEENSGFYVVEDKKGDIVGQGWAVLYEENGKQVLAIDSWENIQDRLSDDESNKLLAHLGYLCKENQKIDEIRLGIGSGFGARMADNKELVKIKQPTYPNSEKYENGDGVYSDGRIAIAIDSKELESAKTMNSESNTRQNDKLTLSIKNVEQDYINSQISAITSAADLCKLICGLPKECGNEVIDTVADQLVGEKGLIQNGDELVKLLNAIDKDKHDFILTKVTPQLVGENGLLKTGYQLANLLKAIDTEKHGPILEKVAEQLGGDDDDGLIRDAYQLETLLKVVGSEQQTFVLKKVADQLVGLIDHNYSNKLEDLLKTVGPAQQTLILGKVAEQLVGENGWVCSSSSLMGLLEAVGSEQQTFILNNVINENGWVKTRFAFNELLEELKPAQQTIILEKTANTLFGENGWIKDPSALKDLLQAVNSEEQKTFILNKVAKMTKHSPPLGTSGKTNTPYEHIFMPSKKSQSNDATV